MRAKGIVRALAVVSGVAVFATAGGVATGSNAVAGGPGGHQHHEQDQRRRQRRNGDHGQLPASASEQGPRSPQAHAPAQACTHARRGQFEQVASWYYDYGNTACGFHAEYGVANKTLPCETHVRISYDGRSVEATVDDRGPYVYGRSYDLDQTVSRVLGMSGVATVQVALG